VDLLGTDEVRKALDDFVGAKDVRPDGTVYVRSEAYDDLVAALRRDAIGAPGRADSPAR
jgi:hypothetical protein